MPTIRRLPEREKQVNTLSGVNGSLGGLLTAPILATLLVTELRWPERRNLYRVLLPGLTASIFGFAVMFAVVGDTFLGVFALPGYEVLFWHFGLAVVLGFVAAALSWLPGSRCTPFGGGSFPSCPIRSCDRRSVGWPSGASRFFSR